MNTEGKVEGAICIPATRLAEEDAGYVNAVMLGATAAALDEPRWRRYSKPPAPKVLRSQTSRLVTTP